MSRRARVLQNRPIPIVANSRPVGAVEQVVWFRDHVTLRGWHEDAGLRVGFDDRASFPTPAALSSENADGATFEIRLDRHDLRSAVVFTSGPDAAPQRLLRLTPPHPVREGLARLSALPGALAYAARHHADIWRFLRSGDPGLAVALRDAFGFGDDDLSPLVPGAVFACPAQAIPGPDQPVVLVVPVHNAREHLQRLLKCLATVIRIPHRIVLVDDGSDDPAIGPMLTAFASRCPDRVRIETFRTNKGFVAAVNHGLSVAKGLGQHVILLNTDTLPPHGWAERLIAPILSDASVASVTPFSNTAEIASIPAQGVPTPLTEDLVDGIDRVAAGFGPGWTTVDIPTGIGFAMAMNRRFLDRIGGFDPAFGRGYGEEVDWCQKARALGGRHVLATSVFIGHEGGASFGAAEKATRLAVSERLISSRYPSYDRQVRNWALSAPHAIPRAALTLAWLDAVSSDPVSVFVAHALGGGAEDALQRELGALLNGGTPGAIVLRAGGSARWKVEIVGAGFRHACRFADTETLLRFLEPLRRRQVIYSCGAGARDPRDIPQILLDLTRESRHTLHLRLHDHFPISPSYCLLDSQGQYRGVPEIDDPDPAHRLPALSGRPALPLGAWRALWSEVTRRASCITAFSTSGADLFAAAFPEAGAKCSIIPHRLPETMPRVLPKGGSAIGVLGGINRAKGADVLMSLARLSRSRGNPRQIVIVGGLDPNYRLPKPHLVTGPYKRDDISGLALRHDIGLWLIPSIWPETFSFTTREALATGLPVLTFDLGAQAEAARIAENGHILDGDPSDTPALLDRIERLFDQG